MAVDMCYDRIILGAGIYGLYAARRSGMKNESVLVLEYEDEPFSRATYVNQARVHMGYHYPRSLSTALKSAGYYKRFHDDFSFAIRGVARFRINAYKQRGSLSAVIRVITFNIPDPKERNNWYSSLPCTVCPCSGPYSSCVR